ncbi:MAG: hypothetical protein PGN08_13805 [Sphingomonas taxi]
MTTLLREATENEPRVRLECAEGSEVQKSPAFPEQRNRLFILEFDYSDIDAGWRLGPKDVERAEGDERRMLSSGGKCDVGEIDVRAAGIVLVDLEDVGGGDNEVAILVGEERAGTQDFRAVGQQRNRHLDDVSRDRRVLFRVEYLVLGHPVPLSCLQMGGPRRISSHFVCLSLTLRAERRSCCSIIHSVTEPGCDRNQTQVLSRRVRVTKPGCAFIETQDMSRR